MEVTARPAEKNEQPILENLMELYLHDFSEFIDIDVSDEGRYGYQYLQLYWEDPDRHPFLIRVDEKLAGFALLRLEKDPANGLPQMDMTEFFILRRHRRLKIGSAAAVILWDLFPGHWQVRVMKSNKNAYPFWKQNIASYTDNHFDEADGEGPMANATVFRFDMKPATSC